MDVVHRFGRLASVHAHDTATDINWRHSIPLGFYALQCDATVSNHDALASCGGLLRDIMGQFIFAFSRRLDHPSPLEAELWGLFHGISLAWEKGMFNIVVATDCESAFLLVRDGAPPPHALHDLVCKIRSLVAPGDVRWRLIPREINVLADMLARFRSSSS